MARICVFTYDSRLDRRVVLECDSLIARGHDVTLYAAPYKDCASDPSYVCRIDNVLAPAKTRKSLYLKMFTTKKWLEKRYPVVCRIIEPLARVMFWSVYTLMPNIRLSMKNGLQVSCTKPELIFYESFLHVLAHDITSDLYIAHDLPMLPVAVDARKRYGGKVFYDSHELFADQELTKIEQRKWRSLELELIHEADRVITINPSAAAIIKQRYQLADVGYIYNADLLPEPPLPRGRKFHALLGLPDSVRIVLYQGGMSHSRNLDVLVRMMPHVNDPSIHLVFLGSGPAREEIVKLAASLALQNQVHFVDTVPQADLLTYSASADLGLIPYQDTCLNNRICTPNKLFEYIAAGTPIVATDLVEIKRIIEEHGVGITGNTANPEEFARMVLKALQPEMLATFQQQAEKARQILNWQQESQRYVAMVEQTLSAATDAAPMKVSA
ncbi:MAG: glycosyltransferase family 4 protein [Rickettsiales bacterium]